MSDAPNRIALTKEQIQTRIHELGEWFHNMDLGGVQTAPDHFLGDYPALKWRHFAHLLPRDLRGKTVLDVGCNAGFYAIEMKRRGADCVLGIDFDPQYLAQARFAAEMCGVDIEFRQLSVYDVGKLNQRFDLVLFLGVLYHLRYPLLALDLLREHVVLDRFVFQSLIRGSDKAAGVRSNYPFSEVDIFSQPGYPKMHFIEDCYADDPTNWWIPNVACAAAMLRSAGFEIDAHPETEVFLCHRSAEEPPWLKQ